MKTNRLVSAVVFLFLSISSAYAQGGGTVKGSVTLKSSSTGLHNAAVRIVQLGKVTDTKEDGGYEFQDVPPVRMRLSSQCRQWTAPRNR